MIYFFLLILSVWLGVNLPKSKISLFLLYFLLFIITVHYKVGSDLENLHNNFEQLILPSDAEERSFLFYLFMTLLKQFEVSFYGFRIICFILWSSSIILFVSRFTKYQSFVIACSFIFPLLSFGSQIRNGVMVAFLYLAFYTLFSNNRKFGIVSFIFFTVLSGFFHYLGFVYLVGLAALASIRRKILFTICICLAFVMSFLYKSGLLYNLLNIALGSYYADRYALVGHGDTSLALFVVLSLGVLINCLVVCYCENVIFSHAHFFSYKTLNFTRFASRLNILLISTIPLLLVSGSFYRIFQNIFILSIIVVVNASTVYQYKGESQGHILRLLYFCLYMLLTAYYCLWQGEFFTIFNSINFQS